MRIQVVVDDALGHELQLEAHDLGFSTSSYVRHLLKKALEKKKKTNQLDLAIEDMKNGNVESITLENFKKQLKDLY